MQHLAPESRVENLRAIRKRYRAIPIIYMYYTHTPWRWRRTDVRLVGTCCAAAWYQCMLKVVEVAASRPLALVIRCELLVGQTHDSEVSVDADMPVSIPAQSN